MAGIVGVVQLVPAALVAPFAASFGDRYARNRVLAVGYATQASLTELPRCPSF